MPSDSEQHTQGVEFCKKGERLEIDDGEDEDDEVDGHVVTAPVVMKVVQPGGVSWRFKDGQKARRQKKKCHQRGCELAHALEPGATVVVLSGDELRLGLR